MNLIKMKIYTGLAGALAASFFNVCEPVNGVYKEAAAEEVGAFYEEDEIEESEEILVTEEERRLLEKIIYWEARGEDLKGQVLVVNVILNRVGSPSFPDTIEEVIFQENQFSSVKNGVLPEAEITEMNIQAICEALCGIDYSQGALYFRTAAGAAGSWHEGALTKVAEHGGHIFYK